MSVCAVKEKRKIGATRSFSCRSVQFQRVGRPKDLLTEEVGVCQCSAVLKWTEVQG